MTTIDIPSLKEANDIVSVVGSFVPLSKRGTEFVGLCPFHEDSSPSFYVSQTKQIAQCFSCGWPNGGKRGDVIEFVMARLSLDFRAACDHLGSAQFKPLFVESRQKERPQSARETFKPPAGVDSPDFLLRFLDGKKLETPIAPANIWPITDLDGSVLGWECRYETPKGKEPRIWSWGATPGKSPRWAMGMFCPPRPLYGLERLAARPDAPVAVFEGPKKADAGAFLLPWFVCVSWTGGANAWHKHDWSVLRGREQVLIWPDNDMQKPSEAKRVSFGLKPGELLPYEKQPGQMAGRQLANLCADDINGLAIPVVRLVDVNRMPPTWDAADALKDGWDAAKTVAWLKAGRLTTL